MGSFTADAEQQRLPKIDFSDLGPARDAVRVQVMEALQSYGCFEAVYPQLTPKLREALLGPCLKELFARPLEVKLTNTSNELRRGYIGQIPYLAYESLAVKGPTQATLSQDVQSFTNLMWPAGNPTFCETVYEFSKLLAELDGIVRRMVLESLGVERYWDLHAESMWQQLRVSEYGGKVDDTTAGEEKRRLGLIPHRDKATLAIVCQDGDGLEIQTPEPEGVWLPARPSPVSVFVIAGDYFRAWSNGRLYSPLHRVMVGEDVTRHSAIFFSIPREDVVIQAPPELVDGDHPALFRPFNFGSYVRFCNNDVANQSRRLLDYYCGVAAAQEEEEAEN